MGGGVYMHINITKGDFKFYEWEDGSYEKVEAKQKELEEAGYTLQETDHDYLNEYFYYENSVRDVKLLTFCRC